MRKSLEKIKDAILEAAGKGERAEFRDRVTEHMKQNNVSPEQAQKEVFMQYMQFAKQEIGAHGVFEKGSEGMKSLEAALREIVGPAGVDMLKKQAKATALSRPKQFSNITPQNQRAVETYYEQQFNKQKPKVAVLRDSAENVKDFDALLSKFMNDPRFANNPDVITSLLDPDMGADIGQALLERDMFEKHEQRFEAQVNFGKSCESFKKSSVETLTTVFGKPLGSFLKSGYQFARNPTLGGAAKVGWEGAKYTAKSLTKGGKLLFDTVRATANGAESLRHAIA